MHRKVIIASIKEEVKDVKTFTVKPADSLPLVYEAGQFLTLAFWHHDKEERRSFSIAASPLTDTELYFTIKRVDNGAYSRLLVDRMREGEELFTTGAAGLFVLPADIQAWEQYFFFAAGIGITPVFSLIKTLLHQSAQAQIVLVYSNRNQEEVVFYDELVKLQKQYEGRFKIEFLYSSSFNLSRARLSKQLLSILLKEYAVVEKGKMYFYTCGPFTYMRMVIIALEEEGIHSDQIKRENFNPNETPVRKVEPPDKGNHKVTIKTRGEEYTFINEYPDSILQTARKHHITLPYSCETGKCGSCAALCTQGQVWLSYNEVLMDADLKKGSILTCVGHPVGGDVVIEL